MQLGASGEVTGVLEALVAAHPLRERLWALLVTALYRAIRTDSRVQPGAALDVVGQLVERSLVVVDHPVVYGSGGTRYRLLDRVRALAPERAAEAGGAGVLADAVVGWVRQMAATVAAGVRGPDQAALVARTAAERATVDAALDRARQDDPVAALRIAADLGWAWVLLDDVAGAARLRAARTPDAPRALQARALLLESWIEAMSGDLAAARHALDAGPTLAGDDPQLAAWHSGFVLLEAADRWYAVSGAGADASLAADLLAGLRSEDSATGVHERRSQVP